MNADAKLVTIQDLLGHTRIKTTERYCKISNLKVQRDYFRAMEVVMHRTREDQSLLDKHRKARQHTLANLPILQEKKESATCSLPGCKI